MRGRKPIPTNLHLVRGSDRPDRTNQDEPQVEIAIPRVPTHLKGPERGIFRQRAILLAKMRVMSDYDVDALAMYAVTFIRWKNANAKVRESGEVVRSAKGTAMQNPYLGIANVAQRECLRILTEFGMTPSSRTRVKSE